MYHYSRYLVGILAPKVYTILVLGPFGKHSCPTPAILNKMSLSWAAPKPFRAPLRVPLRAPLKEHTELFLYCTETSWLTTAQSQ